VTQLIAPAGDSGQPSSEATLRSTRARGAIAAAIDFISRPTSTGGRRPPCDLRGVPTVAAGYGDASGPRAILRRTADLDPVRGLAAAVTPPLAIAPWRLLVGRAVVGLTISCPDRGRAAAPAHAYGRRAAIVYQIRGDFADIYTLMSHAASGRHSASNRPVGGQRSAGGGRHPRWSSGMHRSRRRSTSPPAPRGARPRPRRATGRSA
jgi:hypothetical protein